MKVFPVVHIGNPEIAAQQADIALNMGADGIYLIDHMTCTSEQLFETFNLVDHDHPNDFIGVNVLGVGPLAAYQEIDEAVQTGVLHRSPNGFWSDDASWEAWPGEVVAYRNTSQHVVSMGYLGGVAFKYTRDFTDQPKRSAQLAAQYKSSVDVMVTSGAGTGQPPSVEKIRAMHNVTGKLAVASGISLENIDEFVGIIDEVLVASSVETKPYSGIFNQTKLHKFIERAHRLSSNNYTL